MSGDWRWEKPLRSPNDPVGDAEPLDYLQWAADQCIRLSECLRAHLENPSRSEEGTEPAYNDMVTAFGHLINLETGISVMQRVIVDNSDALDQALIAREIAALKFETALDVVVEDGVVKLEPVEATIPTSVEEWLREQGS